VLNVSPKSTANWDQRITAYDAHYAGALALAPKWCVAIYPILDAGDILRCKYYGYAVASMSLGFHPLLKLPRSFFSALRDIT